MALAVPVTSVVAAVLTGLYLKLTFGVIRLRQKHKVSLGDGGREDLGQAIRAHGNFAEYVPLGLILLGCLELNGAPRLLTTALGFSLVLGRGLHATGITNPEPTYRNRRFGVMLTLVSMAVSAGANGALVFLAK